MGISRTATRILDGAVTSAKLAAGAVNTAKLASGALTADKIDSALAAQLGVSQTGTDRSVSVTQTAELTTTATALPGTTIATSSELTTPANGLLRIVFFAEAKSSQPSPSGNAYVFPFLNNAGTFRPITAFGSNVSFSTAHDVSSGFTASVVGTTYKKVGGATLIPFASGVMESSAGKSQFRLGFLSSDPTYTAYVRNVTATMTYIAL